MVLFLVFQNRTSAPNQLLQIKETMQKLFFFFMSMFLTNVVISADRICLTSQKAFEGNVLGVSKHGIDFWCQGSVYEIPLEDLSTILLENPSPRLIRQAEKAGLHVESVAESACERGTKDASLHGHELVHFLLGCWWGPVGIAAVTLTSKTPYKSQNLALISKNTPLWTDTDYLVCYENLAKRDALRHSGLGGAVFLLTWIFWNN